MTGQLFVLSGPGGVGKDAALKAMKSSGFPIHYPVTATTRPIRRGETDGVDYHFLSREEFERRLREGGFLEHAEVYGDLKGVPRSEVTGALERGEDVLLKVDVQGAETLKNLYPSAIRIFLAPASHAELEQRLTERSLDSGEPDEARQRRLRLAEEEMSRAGEFEHVVYNHHGELEAAVARICEIIDSERARARTSEPV